MNIHFRWEQSTVAAYMEMPMPGSVSLLRPA